MVRFCFSTHLMGAFLLFAGPCRHASQRDGSVGKSIDVTSP
jgi:hypothetical protein